MEWVLDYKKCWALNNWCFWSVVLEKTLESPLDCKEIQPVQPKGNQSWIVTGRTDAKLKLQYFGHVMQRADSLEKTLKLGKIEGRRRRGQQRMRWLDDITNSMDTSLCKLGDTDWNEKCRLYRGFLAAKNLPVSAGDDSLIPVLGRSRMLQSG